MPQPCYQHSQTRTVLFRHCRELQPRPVDRFTWRTTASAVICPSCTRKPIFTSEPTGGGVVVSIKRPPKLRSLMRETSSRPLQRQYTDTPSVVRTRDVRLLLKEGLLSKRSIRHLGACR